MIWAEALAGTIIETPKSLQPRMFNSGLLFVQIIVELNMFSSMMGLATNPT